MDKKCSILCCVTLHCNFQESKSNIKLGLAVLQLLNSTSRCHIRTAGKFDNWTEVAYCHGTATEMRGADKWFVDDENQSHMKLDIWIVRKKKKLVLHSVPAVGSPAVQQTRCFLLMAVYILCTLSGVCKSCIHTSSYRRHGICNFSNPATWLLEHRKWL